MRKYRNAGQISKWEENHAIDQFGHKSTFTLVLQNDMFVHELTSLFTIVYLQFSEIIGKMIRFSLFSASSKFTV